VELRRKARGRTVELLARFGYVAIGISFGIVAVLALLVAFRRGGKTTDRSGALQTIGQHGWGKLLLVVLAAGFAAYALWRFVQAFLGCGDDGLGQRIAAVGKGLLYTGLFVETLGFLLGVSKGGGQQRERDLAARLLKQPGGRWVLAAIGGAVLLAGLWNVYRGLSGRFRKHLKEGEMSKVESRWAIAVAVVGYTARGVVFTLIGVFVVRAAWDYKPREAIGLDGALRKLAAHSYGDVLLGVVAAGLLAYAVYCLVQARYREV
jgi:Domain of Unknown Function (DUF1206)